eukprot:TRINITY_DN3921_c0_g1_i3.p1 TRINITY_DN3921_c0_g1~~TRINITY_DN3921_c0_g1_i3.p1  ORF type:complete len:383 (+),score=125.68 TRINITY_DN3921_c0_g1_i3:167-1315(+)
MSSPKKEVRLDRHSATGMSGATKKDGAGGKHTWGKPGDEYKFQDKAALDRNDPNYDSSEEVDVVPRVSRKVWFKEAAQGLLEEYFSSGDTAEAVNSLVELQAPEMSAEFVKRAVIYALERKERERELTSVLLTHLYTEKSVGPDAISKGFQLILERIEDLILDTPEAVHVLSIFLARAVVDEVIPPAFLIRAEIEAGKLSQKALQALEEASGMIKGKHVAQRMAHGWGPGDGKSVKRLKERVVLILEEFSNTRDLKEADRALRELNSPSFHFYLVKKGLTLAVEKNKRQGQVEALHEVFLGLYKSQLVSGPHMEKGFKAFHQGLEDLQLDNPTAKKIFGEFGEEAVKKGYISAEFWKSLNTSASASTSTSTSTTTTAPNAGK